MPGEIDVIGDDDRRANLPIGAETTGAIRKQNRSTSVCMCCAHTVDYGVNTTSFVEMCSPGEQEHCSSANGDGHERTAVTEGGGFRKPGNFGDVD